MKQLAAAYVIGLLAFGAAYPETESNDNGTNANAIEVNTAGSGRLGDSLAPGSYDTYDWYRVATTLDGKLTIRTSTGGGLDLQPYLYRSVADMNASNPSGDYAGPSGDGTVDSVSSFLRAGTVYVQLIRRAGTGTYSITAEFLQASLQNDAEMNDTPKLAMTLEVNASKTGHLGYYSTALNADYYDWYKVSIPTDGKLTILCQTSGGDLDLQPYLYRAVSDTNNPNSSGDYASPSGTSAYDTVYSYMHAGTIWVQLIRRSGVGSYAIQSIFTPAALANDEEMNDTPRVAKNMTINTPVTGHMGYYSNTLGNDVYDWFTFTTPDEGKCFFTTQTSDGNLDLQLYLYRKVSDSLNPNSSGDYASASGNTANDTITDYLMAGTYFVQVIRRSGVGSYTFNPVWQQALYTADAESNNTPAVAKVLPIDSTRTGRLGYYSNPTSYDHYDWYSFTVPSSRRIVIKTVSTGTLDFRLYIYSRVSDMNNSNPSGDFVSGSGNSTYDTVVIDAVSGTTYYVQMIRNSGVGSYVIASGNAEPVVAVSPQRQIVGPGQGTVCARRTAQVRIFDLRGRLVSVQTIVTDISSGRGVPIRTDGIKKGAYVMEIKTGGKTRIQPLQVLR